MLGLDVGVGDAAAAPPMSADCNKSWKSTTTGGATTEWLYAEFSVPGYDPRSPEHLTAWICDPVQYASNGSTTAIEAFVQCSPGNTCDASPKGKCSQATPTGDAGVVRVLCGARGLTSGTPSSGTVWNKAYLKAGP